MEIVVVLIVIFVIILAIGMFKALADYKDPPPAGQNNAENFIRNNSE